MYDPSFAVIVHVVRVTLGIWRFSAFHWSISRLRRCSASAESSADGVSPAWMTPRSWSATLIESAYVAVGYSAAGWTFFGLPTRRLIGCSLISP